LQSRFQINTHRHHPPLLESNHNIHWSNFGSVIHLRKIEAKRPTLGMLFYAPMTTMLIDNTIMRRAITK